MRDGQVLVEVAAHQPVLGRIAVEKGFPLLDLCVGDGRDGIRFPVRSALLDPPHEGPVFLVGHTRQAIGHAPQRVLGGKGIKLRVGRTLLGSIQRQVECLGQERLRRQRVFPLERQHARQHPGTAGFFGRLFLFLYDGKELLLAPGRDRLGILKQARRLGREEPRGVVDGFFVCAPCEPFVGSQVQLAGCIVAAVAYGTTSFEDRLHVPPIVDGCDAGRTRGRRESID